MTREDFRGLGIAATLTEGLLQQAWEAGCRVVYLGNSPRQVSVYEKIGFRRLFGAVMRRPAPGETEPEKDFFAPGQQTSVRPANWGDLPGVACLMAQPMETLCLDFLRGLVSPRYAQPLRCVSNFTSLWYGVEALGGSMLTLEGDGPHRVLGLGSITPGSAPLRGHSAVIDALAHDNYPQGARHLLDRLVETARQKGIALLQAYAAATDSAKVEHLRAVGLTPVATLPEAIRLNDRPVDVTLLQGRCKAVESEEWRVVSGQPRVSGSAKHLMTWLRLFEGLRRDRQEALRVDQITIHYSLVTWPRHRRTRRNGSYRAKQGFQSRWSP